MPRIVRRAVTAAAVLLAFADFGLGDDAPGSAPRFGPSFGQNRYVTSISGSDGVPDVDDYVTSLRAGETLSVALTATRHSPLLPRLTLLDPGGADATPAMRRGRGGRAAQFNGFQIGTTGRWTVRVEGQNGTEGQYTIAFAVKPLAPIVLHREHLGDDQPLFKVHEFPGLDGALLDFKLTWSKKGLPVALRALTDPSGADVLTPDGKLAADEVVTQAKRRTLTLSALPLHKGDGDYSVRVRTAQGAATYDATFSVTPQGRPRTKKPVLLSPVEPFLAPRSQPLRGRAGFVLSLDGRNFSETPLPRVFFGDAEAIVGSVAPGGAQLDVVVPQGVPGTTVSVAVVNPDGQAAVRGGYFDYLQPIKVDDLVDDAGAPVRAGSTRGGVTLHLLGAFFEPGQVVRFGPSVATVTSVVDASQMIVVTPVAPAGLSRVTITDRFGGVAVSSFEYRYKAPPTFDAAPYQPSVAAVQSPITVTIRGRDFEAVDQLMFDGAAVGSTFVSATRRTFSVPALPAGAYSVTLTDSIGTVERGPDFTVKPPPTITSVTITGGPHVGSTGIPVSGGARIQVDGTEFHVTDAVTLGGAGVTFVTHSKTRFTFDSPPGSLGPATLSVTDGANQGTSVADVLRYVGYSDATATRSPGATAADNLTADRGAVGDLDRDGRADDVVLASVYYYAGTRTEMTRLFFGDAAGKLVDRTAADFPAAGSDSSGTDNWNASAVALGDVDRTLGPDVLIAGFAPYSYAGGVYKSIRLFRNDGSGRFAQDETSAPPSGYAASVPARDQTGAYFSVYGTVFESGFAKAMALGDLDRDGDPDLVVGRDFYEIRYVGIDPTQVDFTQTPPYVNSANVVYLSYFQYRPGTKVYDNDLAHNLGFVDRTGTAMPSAGDSTRPPAPCFQAQDLALGDIDRDGDLDIVETWDDPTTVSAYGTYVGPNIDVPRVATRVLLNDGSARFTDATSTWMPAAATPEFWQANRLALADLDADGDLDLVLLHAQGTDAFNTNPPSFSATALRVLRNDGTTGHLVSATATAVPALPGNGDNFRGAALAVRDVDGDGRLDIVIGTTESLAGPGGNALHATRLFRGAAGLVFTESTAFLPAASSDSGECADILLGDLSGSSDPMLILLTPITPVNSTNGENLRVFDWNR